MSTLFFLMLFPAVVAFALLILKGDAVRNWVVRVSAVIIAAGTVFLAFKYFTSNGEYFHYSSNYLPYVMMGIEVILAVFIFVLGIKYKKYLACVLVAVQAPILVWFELKVGHGIEVQNELAGVISNDLFIDKFSIIMALIIGIVGSAIIVYALGYMKDYAHHHHEVKDRRPLFFFLMFIFLFAMFGIVFSNNLVWLYFFWEITTLCSFLLIGYTKTPEAIKNSFRALVMNLLGGLGFALAIVYMGVVYQSVELSTLLAIGLLGGNVLVPVALLAFAGITKAAQMPFSSWLLGAMVAPTPISALLHSSTMVKAGVYIIVRLAPVLGWNAAGIMVMTIGGLTFLIASFIAISQSNAKKVLAYSTVANLGLIVACGGIGTYEAVWAAVLLIIFHALAKSLLFLCVGTAEHNIGSRDIEDMDGLIVRMPKLSLYMVIGICGMFLAPFGMLISKWAAMKAFVDSSNIVLVMMLVFGSAATLFFWTKWLGKIIGIMARQENIESNVNKDEWTAIGLHGIMTIGICLFFPIVSSKMIIPYLNSIPVNVFSSQDGMLQAVSGFMDQIFPVYSALALSQGNMYIMTMMLALLIILPLAFYGKTKKKIVPLYMSGVGSGDDLTYHGSIGQEMQVGLRNWYMEKYFGEFKMNVIGVTTSSIFIVVMFIVTLVFGGVIS